jgi:hypothetical protein
MAGTTYLANPALVEINNVDLTDVCTSVTYTYQKEALENTSFGQTARTFVAGLQNNEITLTFFMQYSANDVYATLQPLVGDICAIKINPDSHRRLPCRPARLQRLGRRTLNRRRHVSRRDVVGRHDRAVTPSGSGPTRKEDINARPH